MKEDMEEEMKFIYPENPIFNMVELITYSGSRLYLR